MFCQSDSHGDDDEDDLFIQFDAGSDVSKDAAQGGLGFRRENEEKTKLEKRRN